MYVYSQPASVRPRRVGAMRTSGRRRLRGLGALPAATVLASSYCSGGDCSPSGGFVAFLNQASQTRSLPAPTQENASTTCAGGGTSSTALNVTKLASAGVGVAASIAPLVGASAVLGPAALIAAPILAIVGTIFANHAKAVQLQSSVLCENVPAANAALAAIDAGLANGTITPSQASTAYATMLSSFQAAMKSDPSYKTGDALWGFNQGMEALIAQRQLDLHSSGGAAPGVVGAIESIPVWVWLAGGAAAYLLL